MLQSPSGDRGDLFSTMSALNLQFNRWEGVLHVAYYTLPLFTTHQRPPSTAVGAAQAAAMLGQHCRSVIALCHP